jgi:hypothetical protein
MYLSPYRPDGCCYGGTNMSEENKNKRNKGPRQSWKPHWLLGLLGKLWRIALSLVKVGLAAVATVALIVVICGFVLVGLLGGYLQESGRGNRDQTGGA